MRPFLWAAFAFSISATTSLADGPPLCQRIDEQVKAGWARAKVTPAKKSTDPTFLRRVYLDLVGVVPSYEETASFLKDSDPKKREKLIDKLIADPRFNTHQAQTWDLVFFGRNPPGGDATRKRVLFKAWLTKQFAEKTPYDQIVKNILVAEQEDSQLFYVQYRGQPEEATVAVTRLFLGTQLQCARCHDHPFEQWTQRDFYGMAGFFVRLVVLDRGGGAGKQKYAIAEKSTGDVLFSGSLKEQKPGTKGEPVKPRFLGAGADLEEPVAPKGFKEPDFKGKGTPAKPIFSRKEKFVDWLTSPSNSLFARAVGNRVWAQFMGRGLVHPVDDLGGRNAPNLPDLLDSLEKGLVEHKFDLRWLIREIVNSEAYQIGDTGGVKEALPEHYERARVRPLTAEELMVSLRTATNFDPAWLKQSGDSADYYLRYFGEPLDGQGDFQSSLSEHFFLNNSPQIRGLAQARKGNLADSIATSKEPWPARVERLFLTVLNRPPTAEERDRFVSHLTSDAKMTSALVEEAVWVLLTCSEFRFNR